MELFKELRKAVSRSILGSIYVGLVDFSRAWIGQESCGFQSLMQRLLLLRGWREVPSQRIAIMRSCKIESMKRLRETWDQDLFLRLWGLPTEGYSAGAKYDGDLQTRDKGALGRQSTSYAVPLGLFGAICACAAPFGTAWESDRVGVSAAPHQISKPTT